MCDWETRKKVYMQQGLEGRKDDKRFGGDRGDDRQSYPGLCGAFWAHALPAAHRGPYVAGGADARPRPQIERQRLALRARPAGADVRHPGAPQNHLWRLHWLARGARDAASYEPYDDSHAV